MVEEGGTEGGGELFSFSPFSSFITLVLGCHPWTEHDSPVLTSLPLFLIFLPSLHLCSFSASDEKILASLFPSLSVSPPCNPTQISVAQSTAT